MRIIDAMSNHRFTFARDPVPSRLVSPIIIQKYVAEKRIQKFINRIKAFH